MNNFIIKLTYVILFLTHHFVLAKDLDGISYSTFEEGKATVHVIEVDPSKFDIASVRAHNVWETVPDIVKMHPNAVAAINGGFYVPTGEWTGLPMGALKIDSNWYCTSGEIGGAIGWSNDNNGVLIDHIKCIATIYLDGNSIQIDGINNLRSGKTAVVYNEFFLKSTKTSDDGFEYIVDNEKVTKIKTNDSAIPKKGFVLSIGNAKAKLFPPIHVGMPIFYDVQVAPNSTHTQSTKEQWDDVDYIVGGKGILIDKGKVLESYDPEVIEREIIHKKHPRTAIGILPNGHWLLVVVDGRRAIPGRNLHKSEGMTMPKLAAVMNKLGCVRALNLDGGGSTTMMLYGKVINDPCGYDLNDISVTLRKVSDAILIFPKKESAEIINYDRNPPSRNSPKPTH